MHFFIITHNAGVYKHGLDKNLITYNQGTCQFNEVKIQVSMY